MDRGYTECIWLCMQRGRKWIAKDIQLASAHRRLGIDDLRRQGGWWKRYSMFSAVGVKEIKVRYHMESSNWVERECKEC